MTLLILEEEQRVSEAIAMAVSEDKIYERVHIVSTIKEALSVASREEIHTFVVDLKLPDGSGHEFINKIRAMKRYEHVWIVIMTGMVESKEEILQYINSNHCNRYVLKPFESSYMVEILEELADTKVVVSSSRKRLKIRRKSVDYFFRYDEIVYFETVDKMVYLYTKKEKNAIGRIALSELEEWLPKEQFLRVHRSFIVNTDYIDHIKKENNQNQIKIKYYDHFIPIGRTYKALIV